VARFLAVNDYDYWRPVTAIHLADHEGNPRTDAHPGWPASCRRRRPEPPVRARITLTSPLVPDVVLGYTSWKQLTDDVDDARIYGGVHYHFDQEEAARQGRRVGTLRAAAPAAASPPARRRGHPVTGLLLVHGAWHGPWCWDALADRLIRHGHQVRAVQLRGHDQPPGRIWHRVHHNPRDGAAGPDPAPGHHRGHRPPDRPAPAGNGQGQPVAAAATLRRHPRAGPGAVLHPQTAQALVEATFARLREESWPAFIDTVLVWARPRRVRVPVLVLGAEHDGFFTAGEVRRTAAAYGTEAELLGRDGPRRDA
jgi:hypothetical protein